jgi:hypothetical protein
MSMQEPEGTIQSGRRYVLGYRQDFYGIWDREIPGKPVETFELTDAGLAEARKRIARLSSEAFWTRVGPRALRWALFGGLGVWILTGLVLSIWSSARVSSLLRLDYSVGTLVSIAGEPGWLRFTEVVETLAFRLWIGAVAVLVALRLFDRSRSPI